MPLDLTQLSQITEPLLAWYEKNARVLPWRENTDAYRVWVSEIMLQQTRVDTVIPYYSMEPTGRSGYRLACKRV